MSALTPDYPGLLCESVARFSDDELQFVSRGTLL